MSNLFNHSPIGKKDENKNDYPQKLENDNRFLLDIQLLSELKSIPGKIIPLSNNDIMKNNKENSNDKYNKNETNSKIYASSNKNLFTPIDKSNNNINNNYTTNNFFFNNNIINNTNLNFNNNNTQGGLNLLQEHYNFIENPFFPQSNHQSLLSIKSDIKNNNNFLWTDNKFTQNSFHFQNLMIFNGNANQKENNINYNNKNNNLNNNLNNIINNNFNNIKFSQLSYQQNNTSNEEIFKRKKSTPLLYLKDQNNNIPCNNLINPEQKNSSSKETKNIINENKNNSKNKKILFNVENYTEDSYEEIDENIYHNRNDGKFENNNNIFNCYHKVKKRKRKNDENKKYKCVHPNCDYSYKTLKQLKNHHYKMISECQYDSVQLLKLIYKTKIKLIHIIGKDKKKKEFFSNLYENCMKNISLSNYSEFITGNRFDDKI